MTVLYVFYTLFTGFLVTYFPHSNGFPNTGAAHGRNGSFELQDNQKETNVSPGVSCQNGKCIDTLQWAVHLKPDAGTLHDAIRTLSATFDLKYDGQIGSLKHWHLFSHKLHGQLHTSLSQVHASVTAEIYDLNNSSATHLRSSNHILGEKSANISSHYISKNKLSLTERIAPLYEDHLNVHHKSNTAQLTNVIQSLQKNLEGHPHVQQVKHQRVKFRTKRTVSFKDPAFPRQWHLVNHVRRLDINVTSVWDAGYTGKGVTVCVVDDGLEWNNPDLYANYNKKGSWDLIKNDGDPMPDVSKPDSHHGTRCAGEIAAGANSVCGVGVAYEAWISGIRIIDGPMTDAMEATAFTKNMDVNDIYSCSWGPEDDGKTVDGPDFLAEEGLRHGVDFGRHGYGSLIVIASGNGGTYDDNCNFDGYANSIYTITIGAVDEMGMMPFYAEECASMLAVTFSSGYMEERKIVTTDWTARGASGCTDSHTGTSAAAPLAAGMLALAIEANPCLTWRDFKYLIILTAVKVDKQLAHYTKNKAGLFHSHKHGFGLMDAWRLINAARVWTQVAWMTTFSTNEMKEKKAIPGSKTPLVVSYEVTPAELDGYSLLLLEEVQVTVSIAHAVRGELQISLVCPSHTESIVAAPRSNDKSDEGFTDWTFTTVRCWGEQPMGTYKLIIRDTGKYSYSRGQLIKWRLKLHGVPMTKQDFRKRQKLVEKSYSGDYLNKSQQLPCDPAPEQLSFTAPISDRLLKVICMSSGFCFIMAIYETLEYMFCYDDEKKEQAKQMRVTARAQAAATPAPSTSHGDYTLLQQSDTPGGSECIQMDTIAEASGYQSGDGACGYQGKAGAEGYQTAHEHTENQAVKRYHSIEPGVGEELEINTNHLAGDRTHPEPDSDSLCDMTGKQSESAKLLSQ